MHLTHYHPRGDMGCWAGLCLPRTSAGQSVLAKGGTGLARREGRSCPNNPGASTSCNSVVSRSVKAVCGALRNKVNAVPSNGNPRPSICAAVALV